jgi:hypothetical protein
MFIYDDKTHTYTLDGKPLVGFTECFKSLGLIDTAFYTNEGRDRGTAVHMLCQALDEGREIDESKIEDARTLGRFRGYKRFKDETGFSPEVIERPVYSKRHRIACTPDRTGRLNSVLATIDIKGGAKAHWHPFQTAWQGLCLYEEPEAFPRYALYLKDTGRYKLEPHEDPYDFEVARAAAIIFHTKRGM